MDEAFWAWVDETYPNLVNATAKALALDAWRAATERAAGVAERHIRHNGCPDDPLTEQDVAAELIAIDIREGK